MSERLQIAVCDDWEQCAAECADWSELQQHADVQFFSAAFASREEAIRILQDFDAICLMRERTPFPKEVIAQLPRLKRLLFTGERNLAVDSEFARTQGIEVSGTPGGPNKSSTAEHTWALILAATRRIVPSMNGMTAGFWRAAPSGDPYPLPDTLEGDRLGLIGLGEIGRRVARVGQGMGMEVVAWSQNLSAEKAAACGVRRVEKNELLATSKVVSLHLVLSERTRGTVGPTEYSLMRRDALLVNTSRAGLMDESGLLDALESGRPAHAALDVFGREPLPPGHPFLNHPQITATPHLGFVSTPVYETFYKTIVADLTRWLQDRKVAA
jgi:phosphoglycerate dehydrogenase-like enzyme